MARSMVSLGMLPALASRIALRRRALPSGSPPPLRAATVISLINLVNSLPRLASSAPFLCLILCHLECPDIGFLESFWNMWVGVGLYHNQSKLSERLILFSRCNEHGQVAVGIFPQSEEILIRLTRTRCIAIHRKRAS